MVQRGDILHFHVDVWVQLHYMASLDETFEGPIIAFELELLNILH
jgi:hypothetical protein